MWRLILVLALATGFPAKTQKDHYLGGGYLPCNGRISGTLVAYDSDGDRETFERVEFYLLEKKILVSVTLYADGKLVYDYVLQPDGSIKRYSDPKESERDYPQGWCSVVKGLER